MGKTFSKRIVCLTILGSVCASPVLGLSSEEQSSGFGGPSSVAGTINEDREANAAIPVEVGVLSKYLGFKQKLEDRYGLSFGLDYNALAQFASKSLGEDEAAGGVFRIYGSWTLIGKGTGYDGSLVFKVDNRHRLGTDIPPKALGAEVGYAGLTAVPFSDVDWGLRNLYWYQKLFNNRLAFVVGYVDVSDYTDVYGLVNSWTDFSNYAFSNTPNIPMPDQGFGAAVRANSTNNFYILCGIADANGNPTRPEKTFDTFFGDREYFSHLEVGWVSSWERRYDDNIHLTLWHADEREDAHVPDGSGMSFSYCRLFADVWEPFFRAGYAKDGGALWKGSVSAGLGYHARRKGDILGVGLNWSRPDEDVFGPGVDDQYTAEIYYRWQMLKVLAITPDVQLLIDPAQNPDEDLAVVWGLRARISL